MHSRVELELFVPLAIVAFGKKIAFYEIRTEECDWEFGRRSRESGEDCDARKIAR